MNEKQIVVALSLLLGVSVAQGLDFTGIFPDNVKCVHIVAPSSHAGNDVVEKATNELAKAGYKVKVAPSVWKYASDPKVRARDIEAAWRDPETDLVLCARGGKGAWDTVRQLDFTLLKSREIPFVGFSNISVLNNAFVAKGVKRAVTGPMCTSLVNYPTSADSIARLHATLARGPLEPTQLKVLRAPAASAARLHRERGFMSRLQRLSLRPREEALRNRLRSRTGDFAVRSSELEVVR